MPTDLNTVLWVLVVVLGMGTLYAWYQFYKVVMNQCDTCSVGLHQSPFRSKCFVGAVFFTASFVITVYAVTLL